MIQWQNTWLSANITIWLYQTCPKKCTHAQTELALKTITQFLCNLCAYNVHAWISGNILKRSNPRSSSSWDLAKISLLITTWSIMSNHEKSSNTVPLFPNALNRLQHSKNFRNVTNLGATVPFLSCGPPGSQEATLLWESWHHRRLFRAWQSSFKRCASCFSGWWLSAWSVFCQSQPFGWEGRTVLATSYTPPGFHQGGLRPQQQRSQAEPVRDRRSTYCWISHPRRCHWSPGHSWTRYGTGLVC